MGRTLNAVDRLGEPFWSVDEQIFVMPEDGSCEVLNPCVKIVLMLKGNCMLEIEGLPRSRFADGDVLVVPRVCRYRYWPLPGQSKRVHALRLQLDPEHAPPLSDSRRRPADRGDVESQLTAFARHHLQQVRLVPATRNRPLQSVLAELRDEAERRAQGHRFRVSALCTSVLVHVVRQFSHDASQGANGGGKGRAQVVDMTKEYLSKNFGRSLGLAEIAASLQISREHLARVFKHETGQTVFQHLQHLRLEHAKTLLLSSERSMADIAAVAGYSSLALFSRGFKRSVGVSPLRYRQQRWGEATPSVPLKVHQL